MEYFAYKKQFDNYKVVLPLPPAAFLVLINAYKEGREPRKQDSVVVHTYIEYFEDLGILEMNEDESYRTTTKGRMIIARLSESLTDIIDQWEWEED